MRLDLYLKKVLIFKSRSQAHEACKKGLVTLNNARAKGSMNVHPGDVITVDFPGMFMKFKVLEIPKGNVSRKDREKYYRVLETRKKEIIKERSQFMEWLMGDEFE